MRPGPYTTALISALFMACTQSRLDIAKDMKEANEGRLEADAPAPKPTEAVMGQAGSRDAVELQRGFADGIHDVSVLPTMLIRTGQASIEIDSLEFAVARLRALAVRLGGYVANSNYQGGQDQLREATLELRVASDRFDELVSGLSPVGKVEFVNITAQDVGEEYADIAARVTNGKRLEQRLIDLLATRTGKLQDVLEVERELARVREEIERYEGRMRYLKTRASVSTLSVSIHEPAPITGGYRSTSVLAEAVERAWRNFVELVAGIIASLGVLLPVGLVGATGVVVLRKWWRSRSVPQVATNS
jgi:acetolactate synthase regulatory subunit